MTEDVYFAMIGANWLFGFFIGLIVLAVLWAKGKMLEGLYGAFLMFAISPMSFVPVIPVAIVYVIKELKEVK
jgi:hypothetical protein